jgi:crotonobetaine/carnitine-CoA ligase
VKEYKGDERTIGFLIHDKALQNKNRVCLLFEDQRITYEELDSHSNCLANGMLEIGIKKGDKVAILMNNSPDYMFTWLALAKIGAIEVPVNTNYKGEFLHYMIEDSDAQTLILDSEYLDRVSVIAQDLSYLKNLIIRDHVSDSEPSISPGLSVTSFESLRASPVQQPQVLVKPTDIWSIMYTSGTTGPAKGVVLCHNYAFEFTITLIRYNRTTEVDVQYCPWAMYNLTGQCETSMRAFMTDGRVALTKRFSVSRFWDDVRRYGCTEFVYFGGVLRFLWNQPPKPDDADNPMRSCFGAPTPKDIHREFEKRFDVKLIEMYGSTEVGFPLFNPYEERRPTSCGLPTEGYEVAVMDNDDNFLPPNQVGELVVRPKRPHMILNEYYKKPEATLEAFSNLWFHTGDLVRQDEEGYFYYVQRKKEAIRRRGQNISSLELETILNTHPDIIESAAVGIPSEFGEEDVMVFIVVKEGHRLDHLDLMHFCEERMPYFMVPRYVEFVDDLPKTGTAKTEKYKLKERGLGPNTWDREKVGYQVKR